jgi:hypothetical protein
VSPTVSVSRQVRARGRTYEVVDDLTTVYRVLIHGSVRDAVTGAGLGGFDVRVSDGEGLDSKTFVGGLFCLAGVPERLIPGWPAQGKSFSLSIEADGYRPDTRTVTVAANASLPVTASPVALRPLPIRIQGGVAKSASDRTVVEGATVVLTGPGGDRATLGVGTPFGAAYPISGPVTTVRGGTLSRSGAVQRLTAEALAGDSVVSVDDRTLLAWTGPAPRLLAVGASRELALVAASGSGPGPVSLAAPLKRSFPAGTAVQAASFTAASTAPAGFTSTPALRRAAEPGDGFVDLAQPLAPAADAIAIPDAPLRREYATVGSVTDEQGYYAFTQISDLAKVELKVAGSAVPAAALTIDYDRPVNVLDLRQQ